MKNTPICISPLYIAVTSEPIIQLKSLNHKKSSFFKALFTTYHLPPTIYHPPPTTFSCVWVHLFFSQQIKQNRESCWGWSGLLLVCSENETKTQIFCRTLVNRWFGYLEYQTLTQVSPCHRNVWGRSSMWAIAYWQWMPLFIIILLIVHQRSAELAPSL